MWGNHSFVKLKQTKNLLVTGSLIHWFTHKLFLKKCPFQVYSTLMGKIFLDLFWPFSKNTVWKHAPWPNSRNDVKLLTDFHAYVFVKLGNRTIYLHRIGGVKLCIFIDHIERNCAHLPNTRNCPKESLAELKTQIKHFFGWLISKPGWCGEPAIFHDSHHVSLVLWTTCLLPATRDTGSNPLGGLMWNRDSPVSDVSLHWWPLRDPITGFVTLKVLH